jgi:CheY-like chemotaxis protein
MLQRIVGDHIELRWRPESGASPVRLDSGQLNQLLVNLAVNARDALPTGGQLTIETSNARVERGRDTPPWLSPGDYVILSVTDTGTGMSPEVLANAFEPFFTTKAPGKGTGLGLSTVYGVVKQHGGFVTLDSQPGRGTTAKVFLPRVDDALAEDRPRGGVERPAGGTETILLVDDSAGVRELSEKILTMLGYRVLSAKDPKEALRIARERPEPVHLLVTDVVLPEMNGLELAAEVEGLKPGIKSLFMSGYTADVITRHGVPQESVHFVQKPFSLAMLAKAVQEAIDK